MYKRPPTVVDRGAREYFVKTFARHSGGEKRASINKMMFASVLGGMYCVATLFICFAAGFISLTILLNASAILCAFCSTTFAVATVSDIGLNELALQNTYRSTSIIVGKQGLEDALCRTRDEQWADLETA